MKSKSKSFLILEEFGSIKIGRCHYRRLHDWEPHVKGRQTMTVAGVRLVRLPAASSLRIEAK